MKKFTLAIATMCTFGAALSADAQETYVVEDPSIDPTIAVCAEGGIYDVFALGDAAMEKLAANSKIKVNDYRVATDGVGSSHYPGGNAGWASDDDYAAVPVPADGRCFDGMVVNGGWYQWWSGFYMTRKSDTNLTHVNENSHLHIAFYLASEVKAPSVSVQWFKHDGNDGTAPAFAITDDIVNNKQPVVAPALKTGEWMAVDITLGKVAELMKDEFDVEMDYTRLTDDWQGEAVAINLPDGQDRSNEGHPEASLGDGAKVFVDGAYVYTPSGSAGITGIENGINNVEIFVSDKTISALGSDNAPMQLYNLAGAMVRESATAVIGLEGLTPGVYVVKTAGAVKKVIIR